MYPRTERTSGQQLIEHAILLSDKNKQLGVPRSRLKQALEGRFSQVLGLHVKCGIHTTQDMVHFKSIRIFVSSTFTDTEKERNYLMKDVYPFLNLLCKTLGMEFETVDMRWVRGLIAITLLIS